MRCLNLHPFWACNTLTTPVYVYDCVSVHMSVSGEPGFGEKVKEGRWKLESNTRGKKQGLQGEAAWSLLGATKWKQGRRRDQTDGLGPDQTWSNCPGGNFQLHSFFFFLCHLCHRSFKPSLRGCSFPSHRQKTEAWEYKPN